jgi:hypothetical protein
MTCTLTGAKHAAARFHAAPRRIISHGLIRKQTFVPRLQVPIHMGEITQNAKQLLGDFRRSGGGKSLPFHGGDTGFDSPKGRHLGSS